MRVFRAAIALLLSSCAAQLSGADRQHIEEIFVTDDGSVRFGAVTITDQDELSEKLSALSRQTRPDVLLIRGDEGDRYYLNAFEVRDRAYDAGFRFVMMTDSDAVCEHGRIESITTPHSGPWIIRTTSGNSFEIEGQDFIDPRQWRARQNVLVCPNWQGFNLFDVGNIERGEALTTLRLEPHAMPQVILDPTRKESAR